MSRGRLEADVQEDVTKWATLNGLIPLRLNVVGRKGWPDYGYGYMGHMCFIEFKRPGEKPDPLQEYVHKVLREAWFFVFVVDNADYGVTLLANWKRDIDENINVARLRAGHDPKQRPGSFLRIPVERKTGQG